MASFRSHWLAFSTNVTSCSMYFRAQNVCTVTLNPVHWIEGKFSNYNRLLRVNAWIHRFISNLKLKRLHKPINIHSRLSVSELNSSEAHLFSLAQNRHFHDELLQLCHDKPIKANSRLISLNPFIDKDYLLRVGGRLSNSSLSFDQKHPIIRPNNDILTGLLVSNLHVSLCHCVSPSQFCRFKNPHHRSQTTGTRHLPEMCHLQALSSQGSKTANVVFISPEHLVALEWRNMLASSGSTS